MLLFNLAQGLKGPQKNLSITLKAKNQAKLRKSCFPLTSSETVFPFWGPKIKLIQKISKFSFWRLFYKVKMKFFFQFSTTKNLIFKVSSLGFRKNEKKLPIFWN